MTINELKDMITERADEVEHKHAVLSVLERLTEGNNGRTTAEIALRSLFDIARELPTYWEQKAVDDANLLIEDLEGIGSEEGDNGMLAIHERIAEHYNEDYNILMEYNNAFDCLKQIWNKVETDSTITKNDTEIEDKVMRAAQAGYKELVLQEVKRVHPEWFE